VERQRAQQEDHAVKASIGSFITVETEEKRRGPALKKEKKL
jgi:hypothetical protein